MKIFMQIGLGLVSGGASIAILITGTGLDIRDVRGALGVASHARADGSAMTPAGARDIAIKYGREQLARVASEGGAKRPGEPVATINNRPLEFTDLKLVNERLIMPKSPGGGAQVESVVTGASVSGSASDGPLWSFAFRAAGVDSSRGPNSAITIEVVISDATGELISATLVLDPGT
jgi:hypothetical protein